MIGHGAGAALARDLAAHESGHGAGAGQGAQLPPRAVVTGVGLLGPGNARRCTGGDGIFLWSWDRSPAKIVMSHMNAASPRQSLVKGERLTRYELAAVILWQGPCAARTTHPAAFGSGHPGGPWRRRPRPSTDRPFSPVKEDGADSGRALLALQPR